MSDLGSDYFEPEPSQSDSGDESGDRELERSEDPMDITETESDSTQDYEDGTDTSDDSNSEPDEPSFEEDSSSIERQDLDEFPSSTEDSHIEQYDDESDSQEAELDHAFEGVLQEDTEPEPIIEEPLSSQEYSEASEDEPEETFSDEEVEQGFQESELDEAFSMLDAVKERGQNEATVSETEEGTESIEIDWSELSKEPTEVPEKFDEFEELPEAENASTADRQMEAQEFEETSSGRGYVLYHPKIDMYSLKGGISQEDALRFIEEMENERGAVESVKDPDLPLEEPQTVQPSEEATQENPETSDEVIKVEDQPANVEADKYTEQKQEIDQAQKVVDPAVTLAPEGSSYLPNMPMEESGIFSDGVSDQPLEEAEDLYGVSTFDGAFQSNRSAQETEFHEIDESDIIGTPIQDADGWHKQELGQTCVQTSCEGIIHKHHPEQLGFVSEESLMIEATNDGKFNNGTNPEYIKDILEMHDVPARRWGNAKLDDIWEELQKGHDIIVGVDAGYFWNDLSYEREGHAIRVTGLKKDSFDNLSLVYVRDSGNPDIDGMGEIPVETFETAWKKMDNFMVSTLFSASQTQAMQGENS